MERRPNRRRARAPRRVVSVFAPPVAATYGLEESGAPTTAHRDAGDHGLTAAAATALHNRIADRLNLLHTRTVSQA
jgi:hypothetical protein